MFEALKTLALKSDSLRFVEARTLHVSKSGSILNDGSVLAPFLTIQAAVNAAAALVPAPSVTDPVVIKIGPGVYDENVTVKIDGLVLIGSNYLTTIISPSTGPALCVTNATLASLATFHVSLNFGDLVAEAPYSDGPKFLVIRDLALITSMAAAGDRPLELLGVADGGTTSFLEHFSVQHCVARGTTFPGAVAPYIVARNANYLEFLDFAVGGAGTAGGSNFYNIASTWFYNSPIAGLRFSYITADPWGEPAWGNAWYYVDQTYDADWTIEDESYVYFYDCDFDNLTITDSAYVYGQRSTFGTQTLSNTAEGEYDGCLFVENLSFGATAVGTMRGCHVKGTTTITAGVGVVTEVDSTFAGLVTDASDKLIHAGEDRRGVYTEAAGPGERVISFSPAFPATATVHVQITFEDTGGGYATAMIKSGGPTNAGFTLTTGGNGKFHWHAHKVK